MNVTPSIYHNLFEEMSDGVYVLDENGRILQLNPAALAIFGYDESEIVGEPVVTLFADPDQLAEVGERLRTGTPVKNVELDGVRKNGSIVHCAVTSTVQKDETGNDVYLGIVRDISWQIQSRKNMLERLRYESGISAASRSLLGESSTALDEALRHLLMSADVGWVGILETDREQTIQSYDLTHEVTAPGISLSDRHFSLPTSLLPKGFEAESDSSAFTDRVSTIQFSQLKRLERALFEARGIRSMLVLPIQAAEQHFGFIFFADMARERQWDDHNIELLQAAASMVGTYMARKEAKEALQENQYFLRQVIDLNPEFVFVKDRSGRYTFVNESFANRYGLRPDDFVAKTDEQLNIVSPDKAKSFRDADLAIMDNTEDVFVVEDKVRFPDGSLRWLKTTKRPIRGSDGKATHLLAISADMTEQIESFQALQARERFLQTIINTLPGAVYWKDRESIYLGSNDYYAASVGTTPEAIVGKSDFDLKISREEAEAVRSEDAEVMTSGQQKIGVIEPQPQPDGPTVWFERNKIALKDENDDVYGVLGTFLDITEKVALQEQVQRSLEKRSRQVLLSTQIAQEIASAPDLYDLYRRMVKEIKEQLDFYHVQLLQYDPALDMVVLIAGYGEVGEKMLAMNHAMPMGIGLIGAAAAKGESVMRPTLAADPTWKPNPLLPETKGEIAVPIKSGHKILGVLDVQTNVPNALTEDDQLLLEGLCGQIAIAIESTNLRQELESQLRELMQLQRRLTQEGWDKYSKSTREEEQHLGYRYDHAGIRPLLPQSAARADVSSRVKKANGYTNGRSGQNGASMSNPVQSDKEAQLVQTPLTIRGQTIGHLGIQDDDTNPLTDEEKRFLQAMASEVAGALEAARLMQETEASLAVQARLATELETVAKVSTAAATVLDSEYLLQSVVDLTKQSFSLYHVHVYLINEKGDFLELAAGSGAAGQLMLLEGHRISIFADSFVARAARTRAGVLENDVRKSIDFLPNPMLPDTQSEIAVPMIVGDKIIGILDMQSDRVNAFSHDDLEIYKILASQIAVAHENAKQYSQQVETAKKLRDLDRLKGEFLASMSHELRTPLNSIIGFADVLLEGLDGELNERMEEDVRLIKESGTHLRELIGDILDMSKIEAGKMELRYEEIDLVQMAKDIMRTAQSLANNKGLDLLLDVDGDVPLVPADRTRVRQVLWNIMGNAIKFTKKGSVTLRVAPKVDHILISVRDTGIGIKEEDLPIVFEQFRQVDGRLERVADGTGLGMPISKSLVELHGGDIWVESVHGQGSTFFFTLPYSPPPSPSDEIVD